jgi:hypothetical protein
MARRTVTVTHAVEVAREPVDVFDYTQDPARRTDWDPSFRSVELVSVDPRRIRGDQDGLGRVTIEYKLFRRPERTSAAFLEIHSRWFSGGGRLLELRARGGRGGHQVDADEHDAAQA